MRRSLALVLAFGPSAVALAQGPVGPRPPAVPLPPLRPFPQPGIGLHSNPILYGYGYGLGGYGYGYGGFGYGFYPPLPAAPLGQPQPPLEPAPPRGPKLYDGVTSQFPATLVIQLPAAGRVWWSGELVPGDGDTRVLASEPAKAGTVVTFAVRARWTKGETEVETVQTIDVKAGARSRFIAFAGTPVVK